MREIFETLEYIWQARSRLFPMWLRLTLAAHFAVLFLAHVIAALRSH